MTQNPKSIPEVQSAPTDDENAIAKFQKRLQEKKHIDVMTLANDFMFPLFRRLAKSAGDQEEHIADMEETLEDVMKNLSGGAASDVLEDARAVIIKAAELFDKVLVLTGLQEVVPNVGLRNTDKMPAELAAAITEFMDDAREAILDIQEAIANIDDEPEDEPDVDGVPKLVTPEEPEEVTPVQTPVTTPVPAEDASAKKEGTDAA